MNDEGAEGTAMSEAPVISPPRVFVRPSRDDDVPAMLAIYRHHIAHGVGDLDAEDLKRRRKNMRGRRLPHVVAERVGEVVGYAYAVPFRKRPAYRYAVKHSIYVRRDTMHEGVGRMLLVALIDACAVADYRQMIGYIEAPTSPPCVCMRLAASGRSGGCRRSATSSAVGQTA
jgi:L-amino acid N-acyltransferase YncA